MSIYIFQTLSTAINIYWCNLLYHEGWADVCPADICPRQALYCCLSIQYTFLRLYRQRLTSNDATYCIIKGGRTFFQRTFVQDKHFIAVNSIYIFQTLSTALNIYWCNLLYHKGWADFCPTDLCPRKALNCCLSSQNKFLRLCRDLLMQFIISKRVCGLLSNGHLSKLSTLLLPVKSIYIVLTLSTALNIYWCNLLYHRGWADVCPTDICPR